jgi:hypothetical protein
MGWIYTAANVPYTYAKTNRHRDKGLTKMFGLRPSRSSVCCSNHMLYDFLLSSIQCIKTCEQIRSLCGGS